MSTLFLGQLSPGEIQLRERDSLKQKEWGGGVTLAERLGFVMQFKPGDVVMLIDAYNQAAAVRAEVEGAMDWGAYQVRVLEGPRAGESLVINWAALSPIGPGFTEQKETKSEPEDKHGPKVEVLRIKSSEELAQVNEQRKAAGLPELKLSEVSPPGWSGTVKAMKKHRGIDNPWALAWYMKKEGAKPHIKPEKGKE